MATGDERAEIWEAQKKEYPGFAEYEASTTREIPVVILKRQAISGVATRSLLRGEGRFEGGGVPAASVKPCSHGLSLRASRG